MLAVIGTQVRPATVATGERARTSLDAYPQRPGLSHVTQLRRVDLGHTPELLGVAAGLREGFVGGLRDFVVFYLVFNHFHQFFK